MANVMNEEQVTRAEELVDKLEKLLVGKNPDYRIPKLAKVAKSEATQEILHLIEEARADEVMQFLERSDTLSEEKYATRRLAELKGE